jgi:uncharacterized membrane-anchored protein
MPDALRAQVMDELHARPYVRFTGPAHVLHLSFLHPAEGQEPGEDEPEAIALPMGLLPTHRAPRHGIYRLDRPEVGTLVLAWACHTSYTAVTLYLYDEPTPTEPFSVDLAAWLPEGWLDARAGQLLVATRLHVKPTPDGWPTTAEVAPLFGDHTLKGSGVMAGAGAVWSGYRIHDDGFGRLLLGVKRMSRHELGRTVQRLLNIEDHTHMALMALPDARAIRTRLRQAEAAMAEVTQGLTTATTNADKRAHLDRLMALSAELERELALANARFTPALSYFRLLEGSFAELRETKLNGLLPSSRFVMRRVRPAVDTYEELRLRLDDLARRIARASQLLRTALDLELGEQNQFLLARLEERARMQFRLQQTVEGLSVVAITYYAVGLLGQGFKGLKAAGWSLSPELLTGQALPVVFALVWGGGHLLRRRLHRP